ncbi:acyl-CoA synthetase family member 3 [Haematobia irritans]|uniref:acyl-CoA synthetase family member 3 n=1 Tax=Haematobia irritans TaxID=7368 RepID=UPI003F4F4F02
MRYLQPLQFPYYFQRRLSSIAGHPLRPEYLSKLRDCFRFEEHKQIVVPIFKKALLHGNHVAVRDSTGDYSYFQLYVNSKRLARQISNICGSGSNSSVGLLFSNDVLPILCLWACWMSGQIVIPLKTKQTFDDLSNIVAESQMKMLISPKMNGALGRQLAETHQIALLSLDQGFLKNTNHHQFNLKREIFMTDNLVFFESSLQNIFYTNGNAMKVYFSKSKEAHLLSHRHINNQMKELINVWSITSNDRILNILPSHQISSYIGTTIFPLVAGGTLHIHDPFNPVNAWSLILGINVPIKERINLVIAEPQVYASLLMEYEKLFSHDTKMLQYVKDYCSKNIRLMISCNDKLSQDVFSKWLEITGHTIFENFDITEFKASKENCIPEAHEKYPIKDDNGKLIIENRNLRIIDSKNNILMESHGRFKKKIYTTSNTVIGNLWVSSYEGTAYVKTGDIVYYQEGIFTILGREK